MLALLFGALGIIANMLIYQQKTEKNLLLLKLISDIIWAIQYALLHAYGATATAMIAILRECVFLNQKKGEENNLWLVFFLFLAVCSAIFTWQGMMSILPVFGSILSIISFWKHIPSLSRGLAVPISVSMLTYDILCGSYAGILNEVLTLISSAIGIIRYSDHKK